MNAAKLPPAEPPAPEALVHDGAGIVADLRLTLQGQHGARRTRDDDALAYWSRRRLAALRNAYPNAPSLGPFPVYLPPAPEKP
jgi:hypothetical protein